MRKKTRKKTRVKRRERILFWFAVITSVVLYVLFIVLLFTVKKPVKGRWFTGAETQEVETTTEAETETSDSLIKPFGGN